MTYEGYPTVVLGGGLGDILHRCWLFNAYQMTVESKEPVNVICASVNTYVHELFIRHPNWDNLRVYVKKMKPGQTPAQWKEEAFAALGLDVRSLKAVKPLNTNPDTVRACYHNDDYKFYTPQWFGDPQISASLGPKSVVFHQGAGGGLRKNPDARNRSMPDELADQIIFELIARGFDVHALYRAERLPKFIVKYLNHEQVTVHTATDVPTTLNMVRNCAGVVATYSAILQAAYFEHKPNFACWPDGHEEWADPNCKYMFGRQREESADKPFGEMTGCLPAKHLVDFIS